MLSAQPFSCVWLFGTPWTIALQAPLSMRFPKQEYWSGLPFPSPDLPYLGVKPTSPALAGGFFSNESPGKRQRTGCVHAQSCPTLRPHGLYSARLLCPWDFPGKNTGVVSSSRGLPKSGIIRLLRLLNCRRIPYC